jgi:phosphoglycerate dehydrogenase-like enzyme
MAYRCAILDDYQNVALQVAGWSKIKGQVKLEVFNESIGPPDKVIAALRGFHIMCLMRERTPFQRNVIEALPDLKLIVTSGARNAAIDAAAAGERIGPATGRPVDARTAPQAA